jgi:hypothetical protein
MTLPAIPPALRHLGDDMENLHQQLRTRKEDGGSAHIHNPADLYATFTALVKALDLVPTIVHQLLDHLHAWDERGTLLLTPLTPADHTVAEGVAMMDLAVSSAMGAQEHTGRSLATLLMVLSHYSPNVAERGPGEEAMSQDDARTTRQAIRYLERRVHDNGVKPFNGDLVDQQWLYLMLQVTGQALQEGRRADAVKTMTDPSISDGTWRPRLLALLVDLAQLLAGVQDNGRETLA